MIICMKNYVRIETILSLSLALNPAQALFAGSVPKKAIKTPQTVASLAAPEESSRIPVRLSPVSTGQAIREQVKSAAMRAKEQLDSESGAETEVPDLEKLEETKRRQEEDLEKLRKLLSAQQNALSMALTDPDESYYNISSGLPGSDTLYSSPLQVKETESEPPEETETETQKELPEETETEFHPVEMGASIPDVGAQTAEETETESQEGDSSETEEPSEDPDDGGEEESETKDGASSLVSRHGVFAVPEVNGLNEARINLYDYRMLREYPLSRLPKNLLLLQTQLQEQISEYEGTWSVFVQNLTTGQIMILNDTPMRSASIMKLFIMETVYEAFDRGDLPRNEDMVYLLRSMIINSSNESSNRLLEILGDGDMIAGVAKVNEFIQLRGYSSGTVEYNGFQDNSAIVDPGHANAVTAKDVGLLLSRVYSRSFLSRRVCNEIEQMMLDQETRYKIPRGLPEGVLCGNKSGETDSIANDAAVIYGPTTDYILVVLSNDWSSENAANEQVQAISSTVYSFFEG